jgi:hypothetical protein
VNKRLIETPTTEPVYFNVPPSITKLLAALEELPIPLLDPPFTRDVTDRTPPLMVVMPEYELVLPLAIVQVELPDLVNAEVPEVGFDQDGFRDPLPVPVKIKAGEEPLTVTI